MEVLQQETIQLSKLGKDEFGMIGVAVFQFAIINLCEFLGVSWGEAQIAECGQLAYSEAFWLSLSELKLFTVRVKTSHYTSHKNFSPAVLMDFLKEFTGEMMQARGEYYGNKPSTKWVEPKEPVSPERIDKAMEELKAELARNLEEFEQKEAAKEQSEREQRRKQWLRDASTQGVNVEEIIKQFSKK